MTLICFIKVIICITLSAKEEFKSVVKYCAINKLSVNFSKTNYILVSSSRLSRSINVNNIKIKNQIKYLGVYIDQHLHRGPHIKHINNKLAKIRGIITKLKYYVNLHAMKQLYYSFIFYILNSAFVSYEELWRSRRVLSASAYGLDG